MGVIVTRAEAIRAGVPRYFTGKPCKSGHIAERYTLKGSCVECHEGYLRAERARYQAAQERRKQGLGGA